MHNSEKSTNFAPQFERIADILLDSHIITTVAKTSLQTMKSCTFGRGVSHIRLGFVVNLVAYDDSLRLCFINIK